MQFNGKTYHVQTEDRRREEPIIESLVYLQGQIVDSRTMPYPADLTEKDREPELAERLEAQHRQMIRWIKGGRYDPDAVKPFGHGIITARPFDEVVLEFIRESAKTEKAEIQVEKASALCAGTRGALRIRVRTDLGRALPSCQVGVQLESEDLARPVSLFQGQTDAEGTVVAELNLPDRPSRGELRISAGTSLGAEEIRLALDA